MNAVVALFSLLVSAAPSVAVLPPTLGPGPLAHVEDVLRLAVDDVDDVRSLSAEAVHKLLLSAANNGIRCDPGVGDCPARIGAFAGVDFVLVAAVDGARVRLQLVDATNGRVVRNVEALVTPGGEQAALAALVGAVFGKGEARGRLRVEGSGNVVIDGVDRGPLPFAELVAVGPHDVRSPAGSARVEVPAGGEARVVLVGERQVGLLGRVGFGVGAIGSVVAISGVIGAAVVAPDENARTSFTARQYNDGVNTGRALLALGAAGGAIAVAGAVLWMTNLGDPG